MAGWRDLLHWETSKVKATQLFWPRNSGSASAWDLRKMIFRLWVIALDSKICILDNARLFERLDQNLRAGRPRKKFYVSQAILTPDTLAVVSHLTSDWGCFLGQNKLSAYSSSVWENSMTSILRCYQKNFNLYGYQNWKNIWISRIPSVISASNH